MYQGLERIHRLSSAHQHSVAVIRMVCQRPDKPRASGGFLIDPSVAWISLSSRGSITHCNGRRQTSGDNSYSSAWSYHKPEGGGEGKGERDTPRPKLTDRNHWPSYPRVTQINVVLFFFPSAGMAYFLNQAIVSQNTKYFSTTAGPTYRNPLWMGLIVEEKEKEKKRDGKKNLGMLLAFNSFSSCMET